MTTYHFYDGNGNWVQTYYTEVGVTVVPGGNRPEDK